MSKIRVVMAEMEGSDDSIQTLVSCFLNRLDPTAPASPASLVQAPAPPAIAAPAAPAAHPFKNAVKKASKPAEPASVEAAPAPRDGSTNADITALLKKRPMTSGDLIKALPHRTAAAIYSGLDLMRNTHKSVITKEIEGQVGRYHFLKEAMHAGS